MLEPGKIGVFDSGYGGLTILKEIRRVLPQYDYIYLGDNARAPYGTRSFDIVYQFTLQAVRKLFELGCNLVILACNTASAKALRTIQQNDLANINPDKRVLGVIRPTVEVLGDISRTRHIGLLATPGTVNSGSYSIEVTKLFTDMHVTEQACPMWVPIVENGEAENDGADWYVKKYIDQLLNIDPEIDTIVLGCTHYPILLPKIRKYVPEQVKILPQGDLIAVSLADYLKRHPKIETNSTKNGTVEFLTTESPEKFDSTASLFMGAEINSKHITL